MRARVVRGWNGVGGNASARVLDNLLDEVSGLVWIQVESTPKMLPIRATMKQHRRSTQDEEDHFKHTDEKLRRACVRSVCARAPNLAVGLFGVPRGSLTTKPNQEDSFGMET